MSDLRHALRSLRRAPAFTVAATLCTALAVGANAAVFSVVSGVLLRPLPYPRPAELMVLWERTLDGTSERNVVSPKNYTAWRARSADVVRLVVGGGLRTTALGVVAGMGGALAATRLLASSLYGVQVTDPLVYAGVAALLVAVATVASWLPARRAARVDPATTLRSD